MVLQSVIRCGQSTVVDKRSLLRSLKICANFCLGTAILSYLPCIAQSTVDFSSPVASFWGDYSVNYRAWAPSEVARIRGVVLSLPGTNGDARNLAGNNNWRRRLATQGFAVVGAQYVVGYFGSYAETAGNMQTMLTNMASVLGRPEIANAPMIVVGHSHGGYSAQAIARGAPERVLGYIADKGSEWAGFDPDPADPFARVPGLMVVGHDDPIGPTFQTVGDFWEYRDYMDADVSLQIDWTGRHAATSLDAKFAFIDQLNRTRYPQGQVPSLVAGNPLQPVEIPRANGWLSEADISGLDWPDEAPNEWPHIEPAAGHTWESEKSDKSWLPNQAMALVNRAHNAVPVGISSNALSLSVLNTTNGVIPSGAAISLNVSLSEIQYSEIQLYHQSDLIAQLGHSSTVQNISYTPTEAGIHTFVAVAKYQYDGQEHFTSKYVTVGVPQLPSSLVGDFNLDSKVDGRDFLVWQRNLNVGSLADWQADYGSPSSAVFAAAFVPEPNCALLLSATGLYFWVGRGARSKHYYRAGRS